MRTEALYGDRVVRFVYSSLREHAPSVYRLVTGRWSSQLLGLANYDLCLGTRLRGPGRYFRSWGIDPDECLESPESLDTPRKIFERRIRYWDCRPMEADSDLVVSPADARTLVGSFEETSSLFVKDKFFAYEELLGPDRLEWLEAFRGGEFAVFRLTPDKYHWNHTPVAGVVQEVYAVDGVYHSCNPAAVVVEVTPYGKNRRVVTVIDTDVPGGTGVGLVAMVEVVAMMIGDIVQAYSENRYDDPRRLEPGMFLRRGQPKSLYRPGSSTDILLFQPGRIAFAEDLLLNRRAPGVQSRFTLGFQTPLVETELQVRSAIARRVPTEEGDPS
ncbi:MAG: phosphatidylserine decarboxylase [Deferrisomatales bacterium]|nr:phosphatidylserine decarboxylase [Deferrisomatales bacterium]